MKQKEGRQVGDNDYCALRSCVAHTKWNAHAQQKNQLEGRTPEVTADHGLWSLFRSFAPTSPPNEYGTCYKRGMLQNL